MQSLIWQVEQLKQENQELRAQMTMGTAQNAIVPPINKQLRDKIEARQRKHRSNTSTHPYKWIRRYLPTVS